MIHKPWWTKIAYISVFAALTSTIAFIITTIVLFVFPLMVTFIGYTSRIVSSHAYASQLDNNIGSKKRTHTPIWTATATRLLTSSPTREEQQEENLIDQSIAHYMEKLAKNKPFQQWKEATYERFPLGPGMYGWFARIMQRQMQIGYMILQVDTDRCIRLTEYGLGMQQPFNEVILKQALFSRQKDRILAAAMKGEASYVRSSKDNVANIYPYQLAPLLTVWQIEWKDGQMDWLDAQSGEWLPFKQQHILALVNQYRNRDATGNYSSAPTKPEESQYIDPFDPYENMTWIISPSTGNISAIPLDYKVKKWIYIQRFNNGTVNRPHSYIGIQQWHHISPNFNHSNRGGSAHRSLGETYVIFGSQNKRTLRWIPEDAALHSGSFVPMKLS